MRHDQKGIPKELKVMKNRDESMFTMGKKMSCLFLILIKTSQEKNIIGLTTLHDTVKVSKDKRSKPQVLIMYDHTKGGVDIADLFSTHHTIRIKSKRWPLNAFAIILDMVRTKQQNYPE